MDNKAAQTFGEEAESACAGASPAEYTSRDSVPVLLAREEHMLVDASLEMPG